MRGKNVIQLRIHICEGYKKENTDTNTFEENLSYLLKMPTLCCLVEKEGASGCRIRTEKNFANLATSAVCRKSKTKIHMFLPCTILRVDVTA